MAKVSYVHVVSGLEDEFFRALRSDDRFVFSKLAKKNVFVSRRRRRGYSQKSLLPQVAEFWGGLSEAEKEAWSAAGAESNLNGWRLFVQDTCARIINDMAGIVTPSLLHQSWVGKIHVESPASEVKLIQIHPHFYYTSKKVRGFKRMYEPVLVTEDLALPVTIALNYSSNLVSAGAGSFAKFYARFWHSYQGADLYTELDVPLDFVSDWQHVEASLSDLLGYVVRYDLYIWLYNLRGDLYIDNVEVAHSGQNWARDPFCKDINQGFTRAFYQIPKHWAGVTVPAGTYFESTYRDF